jgi:spore coat protein A
VTGQPRLTDVFGYGTSQAAATYPGRTFEVRKDQPVQVNWSNSLPNRHVLPVDQTLLDPNEDFIPDPDGPQGGAFSAGVPAVAHLHGGHTSAGSDGLPLQWFTRGGLVGADWRSSTFTYPNDQEATALWYHDHAMGVTRLNAYAGLAGFYLIRDPVDTGKFGNPLGLPVTDAAVGASYEVPIVIQDKLFTANGKLFYPTSATFDEDGDELTPFGVEPEMFGDVIVVNGQAWPKLNVEPRKYRFRLLNGSDSRVYNLFLSNGAAITQIGSDGGLLNTPVRLQHLILDPGSRADVIIDFSGVGAGTRILLRNVAKTPYPSGEPVDPRTTGQIMAFDVVLPLNQNAPDLPLPTVLRGDGTPVSAVPKLTATPGAPGTAGNPARQLALFELLDDFGRITPQLGTVAGGALHFMDPTTGMPTVSLTVRNGDTEVWDIYNTTADAHPIHVHLVQFQVLGRQKFSADVDEATGQFLTSPVLRGAFTRAPAQESGWEDTVLMYPGQMTRIIARFATPTGTTADDGDPYVWHCHILSHEEHDMMLEYAVSGTITGTDYRSQQQVTYAVPAPSPGTFNAAAPITGGPRQTSTDALLQSAQANLLA